MRTALALLLYLASAGPLAAGDFEADLTEVRREARKGSTVVRVLTYNVFGVVPWGETGPQTDAEILTHYTNIGREFARLRGAGKAPQIVVLQEMFHLLADAVHKEAGYPHLQHGAGARLPGKPMRSGLVIMSEFPIKDAVTEDFETCTSWDCFANKGFLKARVLVPGVPGGLLIYDTHMNADTPGTPIENSRRARLAQSRQLVPFLARTRKEGEAAIFGGDFNFKAGDPDYAVVAAQPGIANAAESLAPDIFKATIDHQFYFSGATVLTPLSVEHTFKEIDGNGKAPSDHLGVEVHYRLDW